MAYADVTDVKQRLGRYAAILQVSGSQQHPNDDDATEILDDVSAEIDEAIRSRGFDPAGLDADAKTALKDLAAYGAIARLLAGVPMDRDLEQLAEYARKVWVAALGDPTATQEKAVQGTFRLGSHPVIAALAAHRGGVAGGASGGSFWEDEPEYGTDAWQRQQAALVRSGAITASLEPAFAKGMSG